MRVRAIAVQHCIQCGTECSGKRFSANAYVKDMVCSKVKDEEGGKKRDKPKKGRDKPRDTGGTSADLGQCCM